MIKTEIRGLGGIKQLLDGLPRNLQKKALRVGLRAAARLIADEAKRAAPKDTGNLARAIRVMYDRRLPVTQVGFSVWAGGSVALRQRDAGQIPRLTRRGLLGVNKKGKPVADTWYAQFQEFGTIHHAAQPYLGPALQNKAEAAIRVAADEIRRRLPDIVRRF